MQNINVVDQDFSLDEFSQLLRPSQGKNAAKYHFEWHKMLGAKIRILKWFVSAENETQVIRKWPSNVPQLPENGLQIPPNSPHIMACKQPANGPSRTASRQLFVPNMYATYVMGLCFAPV